jgi:DNA adenine methylase
MAAISPVLKYPGSKWKIVEWIISYIPADHTTYLEPFFGSGAVFFNKHQSQVETINDIDGNIVNLFKVIRENPEELSRLVEFTPWSRDEYMNILTSATDPDSFVKSGNELEDARRFLIRCWMAFSGSTSDRSGWASDVRGRQYSSIAKRWKRVPEQILLITERLKHTQIENQPALKIIERYRSPEVCIYADPPYVRSTRNSRMYKNEMTDQDHMELLQVLKQHPGPVILSGYDSDLYNNELDGWIQKRTQGVAMGYKERTEVIWLNPETVNRLCCNYDFLNLVSPIHK